MKNKPLALVILLLTVPCFANAGDTSISVGGSNSFNNNSGAINVNQSNTISNTERVAGSPA